MKKLLALFLAVIMCFSLLAACGDGAGDQPTTDPQPAQSQPAESKPAENQTPAPAPSESQGSEPEPEPEPEVKQDLAEYLWEVPEDASLEEKIKLELRNYSLIQTMEPIFEEASYKAYAKTAVSLKSRGNETKLAALQEAKANLVQEISVEDGIFFLWKDFESMPIVDGESYTEEQLDAASLLGYGYTTTVVKYLIDDPSQAKGNIIMVSGGGMKGRSNGSEGYPAAEAFTALGYNCFLVQRRVEPYSNMDIYMDFGRAIRMVRYYAEKEGWGGQNMIAGMGWSGGAMTLMGAVNYFYGDIQFSQYDSDYVPDEIDAVSADLDVAIPVYGGGLLNDGRELEPLPALYIVQGDADMERLVQSSKNLYEKAKELVSAELNMIEGAPHGFGVGTTNDDFPEGCRTWVNGADAFMQANRGPDFVSFTKIVTEGVLDFPLEFSLLPDAFNTYDCEHKGTEMIIRYTTDVYEDGVTYEKFCRIYLPYGYDPEDKEAKYNVLYFQHGNSGSPNQFFDHIIKSANVINLFDNLFDPEHGVMEPCIVVCPTYYLEYDETSYVTPGDNPAGDGRYEGIPGNYYLEVIEDLIPAVESQLNVYCTDFSAEGIAATREHRAWAGYSRGSVCTWYMFHHNLQYFQYWMPTSANCMREGNDPYANADEEWTNEDAYQYLKETIDAYPDLDFFIFASSGGKSDAPAMRVQMKHFIDQTETFSFGLDPSVNNIYYTCSEFAHNDLYFPFYLYNAKDVLFK